MNFQHIVRGSVRFYTDLLSFLILIMGRQRENCICRECFNYLDFGQKMTPFVVYNLPIFSE